jgi:hypothetical protein
MLPATRATPFAVIAGLDPSIHAVVQPGRTSVSLSGGRAIMDARIKPGHDAEFLAKLV